jgi:hypothetical protein
MTTAIDEFDEPFEIASPHRVGHRRRIGWLVLTPIVFSIVYSALLTYKPTRAFAIQMSEENYPVEIGTFLLLMIGGIYGLRLAMRARGVWPAWAIAFYLVFAVFLLLIGMEEISWGQWFFHFDTPEIILRHNTQGEMTLHNMDGIGGKTEWLRLAFGVGGFVGIGLSRVRVFRCVAASPKLWAWFAVIVLFAVGDVATDHVLRHTPIASLFEAMREVVELLIAAAGCLYLWLNALKLPFAGPSSAAR